MQKIANLRLLFALLFITITAQANSSHNEKNCTAQFITMVKLVGSLQALSQQRRDIKKELRRAEIYDHYDAHAEYLNGMENAGEAAYAINNKAYEELHARYKEVLKSVQECLKNNLLPFITKEQVEELKW